LLESSRGSRWHALWATMLGAGLRPGEALALTWPCLDLDTDPGVVHVRHYLRTGTDGPFLGEPKTARSSRSLDLPHFTTQALRELKATSTSPAVGVWAGLVFHTDTNQPIGLPNARRALRRACADAGLPRLCLYDLRRTAGSLLVDAGVHLEQVADLLGHADVATTRRHYVRAMRPTVPHAKELQHIFV
jgi:integrase